MMILPVTVQPVQEKPVADSNVTSPVLQLVSNPAIQPVPSQHVTGGQRVS